MFPTIGRNTFKKDGLDEEILVSTIYFAMDPKYKLPTYYETMIFGGVHDNYQRRCDTETEAKAQHEEACGLVRAEIGKEL